MSPLSDSVKAWALDTAERCAKAFVTAFTAIMLGSGFGINGAESMSIVNRAAIAGMGAAVSVALSIAAKWAGSPSDASFLK